MSAKNVLLKVVCPSLFTLLVLAGLGCIFPQTSYAVPDKTWNFSGNDGLNTHAITIPDDGMLDYRVTYSSAQTLDEIEFRVPLRQCHPYNILPTILYRKRNPPHNKYFNVNIPVGPGIVEIVVNAGSAPYHLTVYYTEPLAWKADQEPNMVFKWPAQLGTLNPPDSIFSHTHFYSCFYYPEPGIPPGVITTQSDTKDYFKFKVNRTGQYKLVHRRFESGGDGCKPEVELQEADDQGLHYIYEDWYLKEKDEVGPINLSAFKTYYLDLQLAFGANSNFPHYCFASVEIGLVPVGSAWLGIEDIRHEPNTVCGIEETYGVDIRNDGDVSTYASVSVKVYHPSWPQYVSRDYASRVWVPRGGKKSVPLKIIIPNWHFSKTGEWTIEVQVTEEPNGKTVERTSSIGVLCRPPLPAILQLLLQGN